MNEQAAPKNDVMHKVACQIVERRNLKGVSDRMSNQVRAINDQIQVVTGLLLDAVEEISDPGSKTVLEDDSENLTDVTDGRIENCTNRGTVQADVDVGGIVGEGTESSLTDGSCTVVDCRALVDILEADQFAGAISGGQEGTFSGNLFVSDTLRVIDRLSKAGQAEPTDYETLIALENAPKRFGQITVTFKDEDHVLGRVNLEYGDSLDESGYPELPAKEGCAARWSTTKLTDLHLDTVVEAVYTDYITALASIYEREDGRPVFFAKGSFGDRDSLTVSVRDLPGELRNAVESWQLTIPDDGQESHTVRYLPLEVGKKYKVYAKQDGSWKQRSTETIGSYLAFDLPGNTAELAVVPGSSVPAWVIVTAAAAVVLAGGTVLIRRRKKAPVKQAEE